MAGTPRRMFKRICYLLLAATLGVSVGLLARRYTQPKQPTPVDSKAITDRTQPPPQVRPVSPQQSPEIEVYPVGYVLRGRTINVFMSDGTTRTERDAELSNVERNSVTLNGKKLFFRPRPKISPSLRTEDNQGPKSLPPSTDLRSVIEPPSKRIDSASGARNQFPEIGLKT